MNRKHITWSINLDIPWPSLSKSARGIHRLLPTPGNVLFTLIMIALLLWAQTAGALPGFASPAATTASTGTIAYQGRLADANGAPITNTVNMVFRLYAASTGGAPLWTEQWTGSNAVQVSDGLFNVMLGSLTPIPQSLVTGHSSLYLGITVGTDDEMAPRVQLGNVPWAVQALTVPDGSITTEKLAADVSLVPPTGSITSTMLMDQSVTASKLNLQTGHGCISQETVSVTLTGNYQRVPIPGASISFSLDYPSTVLIWSTGHYTYQPQDGGHTGVTLHLDNTELIGAPRIPAGGWNDFTLIKQVHVSAGTHILDLRVNALGANTATFANTCIEFVVL